MVGKIILDVGAGDNPRGDINTDLIGYPPIDCICDAQYLPFKDNSFDIVRSYYVIEHCLHPHLMVQEAVRVSLKKVEIVTNDINWFGYFIHYIIKKGFLVNESGHIYGWTYYYMKNFLKALNISNYKVTKVIEYKRKTPWLYWLYVKPLSLIWKSDIKAEIWKDYKYANSNV